MKTQKQLTREAFSYVVDRNNDPEKYRGFPAPYKSMNYYFLGGKKRKEFSLWAARPSVGKTALLLDMAEGSADFGFPGIFFSLEMSDLQIGLRLLGKRAGVNLAALASEAADDAILEQLARAAEFHDEAADLNIISTGNLIVEQIPGLIQKMRDSGKEVCEVYVDYAQLLRCQESGTRQEYLGYISRFLKMQVAMECDVHVAAAAQLNRKVEDREDKRPMLSDLREAGDLEQDADIVGLLFRPGYYGLAEYKSKVSNRVVGYPDIENYLEVNIAKQRNGPTGCVDLEYDLALGRFRDWGLAA